MSIVSNSNPEPFEQKKWEELFLAIYFNDLDRVQDFKIQNPDLYSKKSEFKLESGKVLDLVQLTLLNQIIWFQYRWRDELDFLERLRKNTERMKQFWYEEGETVSLSKAIQFNEYQEHFYCFDPLNPTIIDNKSHEAWARIFTRKVDFDLYNRILCFDFESVESLLKLGARFDIHRYKDGYSSAYDEIDQEHLILSLDVFGDFRWFEEEGYLGDFDPSEMFGNLVGLAAYSRMLNLLNRYKDFAR